MSNKTCPPCHGNCIQGRACPAIAEGRATPWELVDPRTGMHMRWESAEPMEHHVSPRGLTPHELTQRPATWTPVVDEEDNEPFVLVMHPDDPLLAHIPGGMKVITQRHLPPHTIVPLQGLTLPELQQRPMPWTGLTIAAAIVCFCALVALLVHAAGVHGWLR